MENKQIFKTGDKAFSIDLYLETGDGWVIVKENNNSLDYPNKVGNYSYTEDGKFGKKYKNPSLFTYNPFESKERVVEVSNDGKKWEKRVLITTLNKSANLPFVCYADITRLNDIESTDRLFFWKYMREISSIKELTLQEIAEKFNVPVDSIRIKD
jgi:hypothetical protein